MMNEFDRTVGDARRLGLLSHIRWARRLVRGAAFPVVAATLMAGALITGVGCSDDADGGRPDQDENADLEVIPIDPSMTPPKIVFSPGAQADDPSFNAFLREFADICVHGEYDKYRLKVRRRSDPVSKDSFEKVWHHVEQVVIDRSLPLPPSEDTPGPRYAVFAKVKVNAPGEPEKIVALQVLKEHGAWAIDALPADILNRLLAAATQPTTRSTSRPTTKPIAAGASRNGQGG